MNEITMTIELEDMAQEYIEKHPEEFPTREEHIELLDSRIDTVIDYAEAQGYQYDEYEEIFFKKVLTYPASVFLSK